MSWHFENILNWNKANEICINKFHFVNTEIN